MALALNVGKCTLLGNYRENNEDAIEVKTFPDMSVCIVADGMGGQAYGEIASKRAIEVVPRELRKHLTAVADTEQARSIIKKAVVQANEEIVTMGALDREMKNMGTTIVMALWRKGPELHIASLGDSRAYLLHHGEFRQLTEDHSVVAELIKKGRLIPRRARTHPLRHQITRSLGGREAVADLFRTTWQAGDYLLLCSDGLTNMVEDHDIKELILQGGMDVPAACEALVTRANANGGEDNISVVLAYND